MSIQDFEKLLKNRLQNSTSEVDVDNLLIDLHLKKKRGAGFIMLAGLALIAVIILFGLAYTNSNSSDKINTLSTIDSQASLENTNSALSSSLSKDNTNQNQTTLYNKSDADAEILKADELKYTGNQNSLAATMNRKRNLKNTAESTSKKENKTVIVTENTRPEQLSPETVSSGKLALETNLSASSEFSLDAEREESFAGIALQVDPLEILAIEQSFLKKDASIWERLKPQDCPTFKERRWFFALVPEVGYEFQFKSLATTDAEYLDLVNERNANETTLEGYQLGLSLMAYHKDGPYVKLGASYSSFTERMDLNRTYTQMDTTLGIISTTLSESGDTLTIIYGDIISTTTVNEQRRVHYNFKMYDIPLALGYNVNLGNWGLDVEAGIMFNIRTSSKGRLYSVGMDFQDIDDSLFNTSLGIGYFGSIFFRKDLSRQSSVFLGPRFKVRPKHFSTELNPVKQKYATLGVEAGYIFRF